MVPLLLCLSVLVGPPAINDLIGPVHQINGGATAIAIQSGEDGTLMLTCDHVVSVELPNGLTVVGGTSGVLAAGKAEVVKRDKAKDLALIRVKFKSAVFKPGRKSKALDNIWMVGNPAGRRQIPFKGYVADPARRIGSNWYILWVGGGAFYGSSGGALLSEDLRLIGMQAMAPRNSMQMLTDIGYAIPLEDIKAFLKDVKEVGDEWKNCETAQAGAGRDGRGAPAGRMEEVEADVAVHAATGTR